MCCPGARPGSRRHWGGRGGPTPRPPTPDPLATSNYRVPPAHRFHKYKLRLLYFRMQKLTPYSIRFIKSFLREHAPRRLILSRHCADGARHPPPPPCQLTTPLANPGYEPVLHVEFINKIKRKILFQTCAPSPHPTHPPHTHTHTRPPTHAHTHTHTQTRVAPKTSINR